MNENKKLLADLIKNLNLKDKKETNPSMRDIFVNTMACISRLKINCEKNSLITFREALCLTLLVIGNNPHQCAELLGISMQTVQQHEKNTRRKLNAKNRANAFYLAVLKNIVTFVEIS